MKKLWGQKVNVELRPDVPEVPVASDSLSKKCRRLLVFACQRGHVIRKDGDSHFDILIQRGYLTDDGEPTEKGREWYKSECGK